MAKDKTSFVLYSDSKSIIDLLSNEQAGLLLKTLFAYVNDENPIIDNSIILVFEMIKLQLKRDLKKWEKTKEGRSVAGKASAEAKRLAKEKEQNLTNSTNVDFVQQTSTNSTVSVSVSDSVSVTTNRQIISIDDAEILCLANNDWLNEFERINKVPTNKIPNALAEFKSHCVSIGKEEPRTLTEFKQHFGSWVRIKKQYKAKEETNKNIGKL
jgi:hypothetical protein